MHSITFYSYKGGLGRTLTLANIVQYLSLLGQRVIVIDLDLEAPGVHYKLRPQAPIEGGVVDLIHHFLDTGMVASPDKWLLPIESPKGDSGATTGSIFLLPAGAVSTPRYWEHVTSVDWKKFFVGAAGSDHKGSGLGVPFFLELREKLHKATNADFLVIDARTGITELGGIATSVLADDLVCLLGLNAESLDGTAAILKAVLATKRLPDRQPLRVFPVVSRVPEQGEEAEKALLHEVLKRISPSGQSAVEALTIVHSAPELQLIEHLVIGTEDDRRSPENPDNGREPVSFEGPMAQLFIDYLRLFHRLLSSNIVEEHLQKLIRQEQVRAFQILAAR